MKAHLEIHIRLSLNTEETLHDVLARFAKKTKGWSFPHKPSMDYQGLHRGPAGFVDCVSVNGLKQAGVAVANTDTKRPSSFRVTNIVPKACSGLTLDEYNAIGLAFAREFGKWLRNAGIGRVKTVGPNKTLADIIPGIKSRQLFESWLKTPLPLAHPSDLYVLDRFICHIFRHHGNVRTYEIESYLVHDRGWKPEAARVAIVRIETGLELLRVDRTF